MTTLSDMSSRDVARLSQVGGAPAQSTALVCDERPNVRAATLRALSSARPGWRAEGVRPHELVAHYRHSPVQVVLVGIQRSVSTGPAAVAALCRDFPAARVIVFGGPHEAGHISEAIAGGARGFVRWTRGESDLATNLTEVLSDPMWPGPSPLSDDALQVRLTERELQVLRAMSQGKPNRQIGRELFLTEDTIKTHAKRIFKKLGVRDRAQAVAHGFRHGLLT
ncbi:MAG TPA: response regulator transcription factor [Pseudonocardia sp.]|jgi:DNA-binding NarL/FixJ family response regulator|nr:response regulator transcription factor [Pseudonocardia sp.]